MGKENKKPEIPFEGNIILASDAYLSPDKGRNILVFGGSGIAKHFYYTDSNLMQCNTSYVCADPSGGLYQQYGKFLEDKGYKVKCLNLAKMDKGNRYNPFRYIHSEEDIESLVSTLLVNTSSSIFAFEESDTSTLNDFQKTETALLTALIAYVHRYCRPDCQNFTSVMRLLLGLTKDAKNDACDSSFPLDAIFNKIQEEAPGSFAIKNYDIFRKKAGKTPNSYLLSCTVRLDAFILQDVADLTKTDDIDLETVCNEKTALFVITPPNTSDFHFLASIMYTQLLDIIAKHNFEGGSSIHLIMDQPEMVMIPRFASRLNAAQKCGLITSLLVHSPAVMARKYGHEWENISEKCDAAILLNQGEIDIYDWFRDYAGLTPGPRNFRYRNFRYDMTCTVYLEDVRTLIEDACLVFIKGAPTIKTWKYKSVDHPLWGCRSVWEHS